MRKLLLCAFCLVTCVLVAQESKTESIDFQSTENSEKLSNQEFKDIEKVYLERLKKDEDDLTFNYKLGMLYYNKGVEIVNKVKYEEISIAQQKAKQDSAITYFNKALPYMKKAEGYFQDDK